MYVYPVLTNNTKHVHACQISYYYQQASKVTAVLQAETESEQLLQQAQSNLKVLSLNC